MLKAAAGAYHVAPSDAGDDAFWDEFCATTWGARPAVLPHTLARPRLDGPTLFEALLRRAANPRGAPSTRLFVDDRLVVGALDAFLPVPADRDLAGFDARLRRELEGREYCLVQTDLHLLVPELWTAVCAFLAPLFERVGVPSLATQLDVFLGSYRQTPFGVHVDRGCHSLFFPTVGRKRLRFWDEAYALERRLAARRDVDVDVAAATTLEGDAGDALYWPPQLWHVADGDGAFSASWGIGLFDGRDAARFVLDALGAAAPTTRPNHITRDGALPGALADSLAGLRRMFDEPEAVLQQRWDEHATAFGFVEVPPPATVVDLAARRFRLAGPAAILSAAVAPGRLRVTARGASFVTLDTPTVRDVVACLNRRGAVAIEPEGADGRDRLLAAALVRELAACGVLVEDREGDAR